MNAPIVNRLGHSADVRMHLTVNDHVLRIGQLAPGFIILRQSIDHDPAIGEIFLSVDGNESRWNVHLVDGIRPDQVKTPIVPCVDPF